MKFDLSQFNTYGLDHKTVSGVLYIRPQWTRSGKRYKQWSNVKTKRGKTILDYATAGDISQLYEDIKLPDNVIRQISYLEIFDGENTGYVLRDNIQPLAINGNKLVLNIKIDGEYRRFDVAKIITENTIKEEFFKMAYALREIMNSDYHDGTDITIQVVELPRENPELKGVKQGTFNCVILPVILLLQKQKQSQANQKRIDKLLKYHKEVKDTGLDNEGILKVSKMSRINIAIYDHCGKVWHKFVTAKDRKTLLLDVHNQHAEVRNDKQLLQQVFTAQKKSKFELILAEPIDLELFKKQAVKWVTDEELKTLISKHLDGHIIQSKGIPKALITPNVIYKLPFDEHEEYPDAFTDGGVGKAKFLEQNPHMKAPTIHPILWEADRSGFYMRTGKSHKNNIKFDMNHAYKSFKQSGCFKGFPEQINSVLSFPENTTASQSKTFHHNGLLYVDFPKLDIENLMTKVKNCKAASSRKYPRIYYECSGWYPIEIVEEIYKLYNIDPVVKAIAIGEDTFDIDVTKFTNPQFRAFVGKTTSKYVSDTWRTTDENEYLRALYQLQDNLIGVYQNEVETGEVIGKRKVTKKSYSIEYTDPDKTPWQCPVVAVYVKAHQKLQLFKQYNTLADNGILPRYISVDGIEISGNQRKKAVPLFDVQGVRGNLIASGGSPPKWKQEEIKPASFQHIDVIERKVPDPPTAPLYSTYTHLPRLLHLAGSGGNGKTEKVVKLALQMANICYTATTHNACSELEMRGKKLNLTGSQQIRANTYHRIFGIGTKYPQIPNASTFVIEEASMLPDEHLQIIDERLREKFNPNESFGGRRIILVGDFWQLPVLKPLTPLYDHWTDTKTLLYSQFTVQELTENWRQKADPEFYNLCQKLRNKMSKKEAQIILNKLNERCVSDEDGAKYVPFAGTMDDMYMAGVNMQCDYINRLRYGGKQHIGTKIINTKTFTYKHDGTRIKIPNGRIGVVELTKSRKFHVNFEGIGICEFRGKRDEFKPAYAVTVHKAQGRTQRGKVVIDPSRLFDKNHLYVALTRASTFQNIYLTEPISLRVFAKTCFCHGITDKTKKKPDWRLAAMVKRYKQEEPKLTVEFLRAMRQAQDNKCCYCKVHLTDKFGFDDSITLERIDDEKKHVLSNIKLACFKCNSAHRKN